MRDTDAQVTVPIGRLIEAAMSGTSGFVVLSSKSEWEAAHEDMIDFRTRIFGPHGPQRFDRREDVPDTAPAVVVLPPWGRLQPPVQEPFKSHHHAEPFIASFLDSHLYVERVGFLVPASTVTARLSRPFRDYLSIQWGVELVAICPGSAPGLPPSFVTAFVVVARKGASDRAVRFFRTGRGGVDDDALAGLKELLRRQGGRNEYGFVLRSMPSDVASWSFDVNDPEPRERAAELAEFGHVRTIGDIFEVQQAKELSGSESSVPTLHARDVVRNQQIGHPGTWSEKPSLHRPIPLQPGDFVIPRLIPASGVGMPLWRKLPVGRIGAEHLPAAAADTLIVLRPHEPLDDTEAEVVLAYMRSARMLEQLSAAGNDGSHLPPRALGQVPLPRPDEGLRHAVIELVKARKELEDLAASSTTTIDVAFDLPTARAARTHIVKAGRELRQRADAVRQLDDLGYRIRTRYPYPIAHQWRAVEAALSAAHDDAALSAILECFEVLLGFVAGTVVVAAREGGHQVGARDNLQKTFREGHSPGLGTWRNIVESTEDRWSRQLADDDYLVQVRSFSQTTSTHRKTLTSLRNDDAHLRKPGDLATAITSGLDALQAVLDAARFLTDIALVRVTDVSMNTLSGRSTINVQRLIGDHQTVPTETLELERVDIEKHSLYIADSLGGFHLLRPMFAGETCHECGVWHTFHVDGLEGDSIRYRSFETGHILQRHAQRGDLIAVDLA